LTELSLEFKKQVYQTCVELVEGKNQLLHSELLAAKESGNDETKSSAGDKHETGRAMAQLAQENLGKQLGQIQNLQKSIAAIKEGKESVIGENGALVQTNNMLLFLGISLGELTVNDKKVFAVSMVSPIGNLMLNKKVGDQVSFQSKPIKILEIV